MAVPTKTREESEAARDEQRPVRPKPPLRIRWKYSLREVWSEPTVVLAVILAAALTYLVVAPVFAMLQDAVLVQMRDVAATGRDVGSLTLYYLERVFISPISSAVFWQPLMRTLFISVVISVISLSLGLVLAWLVVRTDLPGKRWLSTGFVLPYILPSWTFAVAWVTVFKNRRVGGSAGYAETLGFVPPDWLAWGAVPIIITLSLHYFPFAFLLFGNGLRNIDTQLEDSAKILGGTRGAIFRRIIVPLLLPALMSAILLTFSRVLGTFGAPYILGRPTNYNVLSTSLYGSYYRGDIGTMAVLAAVVILIGVSVLVLDIRMVKEYKRFVTVGGKGQMHRPVSLGRWRKPLGAFAFGIFGLTTVIPLAILFMSTIMIRPALFTAENFTLRYWFAARVAEMPGTSGGLFANHEFIGALWNSFRLAGLAAIIAGLSGLLVGYAVVRLSGTKLSGFLRQISFMPYLVPSIAFAAAFLTLFAVRRGPVPALYGTMFLVVLVMSVKYLPYASRAGISAMSQLGQDPEDAARIVGANWRQRMTRIVIPIAKGGLVTGILLPFVSGMKELSLVIMLVTPGTELMTTQIIRLVDFGYTQVANAGVVLLVAIIFLVTFLTQKLTKSNLAQGLGG
jgi:iron(III) transport system permease protein